MHSIKLIIGILVIAVLTTSLRIGGSGSGSFSLSAILNSDISNQVKAQLQALAEA